MSIKYRWLVVNIDTEVFGTNDETAAKRAGLDGESITIDLNLRTYTFDGDTAEIEDLPEEDHDSELPEDDDEETPK
jgi:hypothetical protein